ncbi:Arginine--tRNA ligase [Pseudolycoriella hygida]|uniref:arginine--tRNA ligase n=1 Tax=Pseudolycoriella hygida TaxID=35572 RepID=A0A9Q0S5J2_9DIPT|nr:Arginine--tRNA ligase [Pseudolycoriella hygida]
MLAAYACDPSNTRGRLYKEQPTSYRNEFERDRDRIIHSKSFRRLQYKTQVFINHEGDHYRNRLTHSIEVATVARSISNTLNLSSDLAEVVALAHDLGHTPFGHAGEVALNECMKNFGGFSHNAHSLKILTKLEKRYAAYDGLNLTWEVLEGIVKHNGPVRTNIPDYVLEYNRQNDLDLSNYSSAEAQIASLADDISYISHDLEDSIGAKIIDFNHLSEIKFIDQYISTIKSQFREITSSRLIYEVVRTAIEIPKDNLNGDLASNIAMIIAAKQGGNPREIALKFKEILSSLPYIASIEVAGPGFINFTLKADYWHSAIQDILLDKEDFFKVNVGNNHKVNLEYVSANPTGPLHIGHARCAVYGDALARVLESTGYQVTKEYYVNDAGSQIDNLAKTVMFRYKEALTGEKMLLPEDFYPGEYLIDVGKDLVEKFGNKLLEMPESECYEIVKKLTVDKMLELIKADLKDLDIEHQVFFSEKSLHDNGKIDEVVDLLTVKGLIYEGQLPPPKGKIDKDWSAQTQKLFKATNFGDSQDRSIQKADGSWTYFAADLAYTKDKIDRGADLLIYILGADHSGYVKRIEAIVKALEEERVKVDVKICHLVNFIHNGQSVKMSKRKGNFTSVNDVTKEVGKDIIRFMMLTRKNDVPLDFDLVKVKEQSKENPIFYVQYAYVRTISILAKAKENMSEAYSKFLENEYNLSLLSTEEEIEMIKLLASWPKVIEGAAKYFEPHRVAFYLVTLASKFHALWNFGKENNDYRFLIETDIELTAARLGLARAIQKIIRIGFDIIGKKKNSKQVVLQPEPEKPLNILTPKVVENEKFDSIEEIMDSIEGQDKTSNKSCNKDKDKEEDLDILYQDLMGEKKSSASTTKAPVSKDNLPQVGLNIIKVTEKRQGPNDKQLLNHTKRNYYKIQFASVKTELVANQELERIKKKYAKIFNKIPLTVRKMRSEKDHAVDILPTYATEKSSGMDLIAANIEPIIIKPQEVQLIPTGICIALPDYLEAQIRPRSGLALKHGITVLNSPGTIDSDYRGEIKVILINHFAEIFTITRGMKIAQMVVAKYEQILWHEVYNLDETARGEGGFGSTGKF